MKRAWAWLWLVLATAPCWAGASWDASTGLYSQSRFRGLKQSGVAWVSEGTLSLALGPRYSVSLRGLNAEAFSNPSGHLENRLDLSVRGRVAPRLDAVGGWQWLSRAAANPLYPSTNELYLGLESQLGGFRPAGYAFLDVDHNAGVYLLAAVSRSWSLGRGWSLDSLGALGYDLGRHNGFQNGLVSVDLNYPLTRGLAIGPRLDLHWLSSDAQPSADGVSAVLGFGLRYAGGF